MSTPRRPLDDRLLGRLTADPGPWLSCDECFRLLDRYVDDAVAGGRPDQALPAMRSHLDTCHACREEALTLVALVAEDAGVDAQAALARIGLG